MRLVSGSVLVTQGLIILKAGPAVGRGALAAIEMAGGTLLLAGLWTPLAGTLIAAVEGWNAISGQGDPSTSLLLATLAAALAVLGPGAWSVDARLFGWKRIDIRKQRRQN